VNGIARGELDADSAARLGTPQAIPFDRKIHRLLIEFLARRARNLLDPT